MREERPLRVVGCTSHADKHAVSANVPRPPVTMIDVLKHVLRFFTAADARSGERPLREKLAQGVTAGRPFVGLSDDRRLSLSETHTRIYWWCRPPKIGTGSTRPTVWAARAIGVFLCSDECVRASL